MVQVYGPSPLRGKQEDPEAKVIFNKIARSGSACATWDSALKHARERERRRHRRRRGRERRPTCLDLIL